MYVILQDEFRTLVTAELELKKISRSELARRMGVDRQLVTMYLNGSRAPGPDMIERFFAALGYAPVLKWKKLEAVEAV